MTVRRALTVSVVSFGLLLCALGYVLAQLSKTDTAIREGIADAAKIGCQENNARWQLLVDFSLQRNPKHKPSVEEKALITALTKKDCSRVRERFLNNTKP